MRPAEDTASSSPAAEAGPVHHKWLAKWEREVEEEYRRLHAKAIQDPQHAGHGGEATWIRLLEEWLPPAYEVGSRKYIVPEEGDETFETDIVVCNPAYPRRLRQREEVLAGGVAAAFSVKLTLDASGLRDAVLRGMRLRRRQNPASGRPAEKRSAPSRSGCWRTAMPGSSWAPHPGRTCSKTCGTSITSTALTLGSRWTGSA